MMISKVSMTVAAPEGSVWTPGCFNNAIGMLLPMEREDEEGVIGSAMLKAYTIDPDGKTAIMDLEMEWDDKADD